MITHSKSLSRKVEAYIKFLIKPRAEFGGHAICPGLKPYRHDIMMVMARDDLEDQIDQICYMLHPLNVPAAIIATALPPTDLYEITDAALERHENIEILVNDPTRRGRIRGVYTGFEHAWLIIIQQRDLLEKSRESAKTAGYYNDKNKPE